MRLYPTDLLQWPPSSWGYGSPSCHNRSSNGLGFLTHGPRDGLDSFTRSRIDPWVSVSQLSRRAWSAVILLWCLGHTLVFVGWPGLYLGVNRVGSIRGVMLSGMSNVMGRGIWLRGLR